MTEQPASSIGPRYSLLVLTVALGGVLAPLNSTMLAVALPEIRDGFHVGHAAIGWLVSSYLIAMAVAQPLGGRVGDQIGRARMFGLGLVIFVVLSIAAAFSPAFPVLVLLRTGQALVGATIIPNGTGMLRASVPERKLGAATGITGSAVALSAAVGPLVGSGLMSFGSWRLLFLLNAPLVALALISYVLLSYRDVEAPSALTVDWPGTAMFAGLLVALTFVLTELGGDTTVPLAIGSTAALALLGIVFARRQLTGAQPVAEWGLFRNRSYFFSTSYILLANMVMYTTLLAVPFFLKEVQHRGAGDAGLLLGALSMLMALTAPVSGRLSDARGRRMPAVAGGVLLVLAAVLLTLGIGRGVSFGYMAVTLSLLGLGMGLGFGPAGTAAIEAAPRELAGSAAGTNSMMRYLGSITGAGVLSAVLTTGGGAPGVGVFRGLFALLAVIAVLALASATFIHRFVTDHRVVAKPVEASPAATTALRQP